MQILPIINYNMIEIIKSDVFDKWLEGLRDRNAKIRVLTRLDRLAAGNFGDLKTVGGGVLEMRIKYGPGYRVYLKRRGSLVVVVLAGGDKSSQQKDIKLAQSLAKHWNDTI
jgi:putative addiction module killer protein